MYPPDPQGGKYAVAVCQTYLESGVKGPRVPSCPLAHSRPKNFHFDRSKLYPRCYYSALGCPKPRTTIINTAKQDSDPYNYCGESYALRSLLVGLSDEVKRLFGFATGGDDDWRGRWAGDPKRLAALISRSGNRGNLTGPIWTAAIHARVQFPFVEAGGDERDKEAVYEVGKWLAEPRTKERLRALVNAAKSLCRGGGAVYVASETALVRRHIADLLRAEGVQADYFMHSGKAHPVNMNKDSHGYGARYLPLSKAKNDEERADLLFPYLEWWALAHAKTILVKRHMDLRTSPSTYSGSAHLYGSWTNSKPSPGDQQRNKWPGGHIAQVRGYRGEKEEV